MTIHAIFGDVLLRVPPLQGEILGVARIEEGVIARVRQKSLKGEGDDGEKAHKEGEEDQNPGDDMAACFAQIDFGNLAGLSADRCVIFTALEGRLVYNHDAHAEDHHDHGENAGFTGILGVHRDIFCGQSGEVEVVRNRVAAHGAAENQENRRENGGSHHR